MGKIYIYRIKKLEGAKMKRGYLLLIFGLVLTLMFAGCEGEEALLKVSNNQTTKSADQQVVTAEPTKQADQQAVSSNLPQESEKEATNSEKEITEWEKLDVKNSMVFKGIVSNGNLYVGYSPTSIAYSYDGLEWEVALQGEELQLISIMYGDGVFFASSGSKTYYQSKDGMSWTSYDVSDISYNQTYTSVFAEGKYVSLNDGGYVVTAQDGIHWEKYQGTSKFGDGIYLADSDDWPVGIINIIYENGKYLAGLFDSSIVVGNGLDDWKLLVFEDDPYDVVLDIETFENKIICAGITALTVIDMDSMLQIKTDAEDDYFIALEKYDGKIIAFKESGEVLISSDGVSWSILFERPGNYLEFKSATLLHDMVILYSDDGKAYYRKVG